MASYDYWQSALRLTDGKRPLTREEMTSLRISEDDIGLGFFRMRAVARGPFIRAVAIWQETHGGPDGQDVLFADADDLPHVEANTIWLHACRYPIHERIYRTRIETGQWPQEESA